MSKCYICGAEIPRGKKYNNPQYKKISVCSEACYNKLIEEKQSTPKGEPFPGYNKLFDYIQEQWGGNENVNWMLTHKQIKHLVEKQAMSCNEIRMVLKYAIEIEGQSVDVEYGIGQFIPAFIEPCMKFVEQLKKAKELAEEMEEEEVVIRKVSKQMKKVKEEEWD